MPVLEARASLYAVKHFLRNSTNFGQRLLVLTDSMTAAVAYDKGRAQSHKLRRVLEQFRLWHFQQGWWLGLDGFK